MEFVCMFIFVAISARLRPAFHLVTISGGSHVTLFLHKSISKRNFLIRTLICIIFQLPVQVLVLFKQNQLRGV
jgi:hypothetical protein